MSITPQEYCLKCGDNDFDYGTCDFAVTIPEKRFEATEKGRWFTLWRKKSFTYTESSYQYYLGALVCKTCRFTTFYAYKPEETSLDDEYAPEE